VEIYREDGSWEEKTAVSEIAGEGPVAGFVLQLERIWQGI
jgi:hypothetical protein